MKNPFEYGRELDRHELVDRDSEIDEIRSVIRSRGKHFLVGPRRFGKTSLLAAAGEEAAADGTVILRFDAEKYETLELLAAALLTAAARSLQGPVEKAAGWLARAASSLRPSVEMDPVTGAVSVSIGAAVGGAGGTGELPLLTDALDAVEALAEESDRPVVVILDEVQQIVIEHGEAAERQLRAAVQRHRHVAYVFAGSATRLLTAMTTDAQRPFYRLGSVTHLGRVLEADFLAFLQASFRASSMPPESGACEAILELAEGVPYNVQRLAHEVWEMAAGSGGPVTPGLVAEAVERIVRREDPAYTQLWTSLTRNQKKALKAVIQTGGEGLQSADVARTFDIAPASVQVAVEALEDRHLVRREAGEGRTRYRLVDPFVAVWLRVFQ